MASISREAPAKLNLGLEVISRREDGFHEIATILQAISLTDTITVHAAPSLSLATNAPSISGDDNLVIQAVLQLQRSTGTTDGARLALAKRIPIAAGLGGASSDAAAAILAAARLWDLTIAPAQLQAIAASIGSDVPFFLRGGTALATGRGVVLTQLPLLPVWFVVVSPNIAIPRKTATLYAALNRNDFSSGDRVRQVARRITAGNSLDPVLLGNAFARPLLEIAPALRDLQRQMLTAGAPFVALSGAGPSHYTILADPNEADRVASSLRARLGTMTDIIVCRAIGPYNLLSD